MLSASLNKAFPSFLLLICLLWERGVAHSVKHSLEMSASQGRTKSVDLLSECVLGLFFGVFCVLLFLVGGRGCSCFLGVLVFFLFRPVS